jgi:tetratricopeptide (TPR) repeat protein
MSLWEMISNVFTDKAIKKSENLITELYDSYYLDKQIEEKEREYLLNKYGDEPFYNHLDKYLSVNNVISLLISSVRGKTKVQTISKTDFISKNKKEFLHRNPEYKNNTIMLDQVSFAFAEIFDHVFWGINFINPYTEIGKLQNDIHRSEAESQNRDERNFALIQDLTKQVEEIRNTFAPQNGITDAAKQELGVCSTEIDEFTKKIKDIETNYQCKNYFIEALSQYFELLQSITNTLRGQPQTQINILICTLNCNAALCQSNLGEVEKAFRSLSAVSTDVASTSKTYHFVYAAIIVQHNDSEKYAEAKEHIDRALEIDHEYHRAFILKQYLLALMEGVDSNTNIKELNNYFTSILNKDNDRELIGDFYLYRGLIYRTYNDPFSAIHDFETAMEYGYDPVVAKFNLAAALYGQAISGLPKEVRVFFPVIHYPQMYRVIDTLKSIIIDVQVDTQAYCNVKEQVISLYVSACGLLGISHGLSPLKDFLYSKLDYETKRGLILGSDEELNKEEISLLDSRDQLFLCIRRHLDNDAYSECKNEIVKLITSESENLSPSIFHILLQVCLILKEPDEYWKYKDKAITNGVLGPPIDAMDACAYELEGKVIKAKSIFDDIASTSYDYHILENNLKFYARNHYNEECSKLFIRIHELWNNKSLYINDLDSFYRDAIKFFVNQQSPVAEEMLSEITPDLVSLECYHHMQATFFSAINDIGGLYNSLVYIYSDKNNFQDGFNKVLCLRELFQYDDAIKVSLTMLEKVTEEKEKVKLFWLISDIFLLQDNSDESYKWAKKAHELTVQNPYEQSHQAFFARALRCGHQEGLSTVLDYKNEHPVVVNWFEVFSISALEKDPLAIISEQVKERFPDMENYVDQEKTVSKMYREGNLPINLILEHYHGEWWRLFQFAETNKLNLSLGDREMLETEQKCISNELVIDAQTLIVMSYYGCLPALEKIQCVYITYGSVSTLQYCFLAWGYPYITELMNWLYLAPNIIYEPDGFVDEKGILIKAFSRDFVASCNVALKKEIPFLFCDCVARKYQSVALVSISEKIEFISIPALCYYAEKDQPNQLNQMLYNLLKGCSFISFTADTIFYQIQKNNYQQIKEVMQPFLICKSTYDMNSFASVYLQAIFRLQKEYPDAAIELSEIILSDTTRIWKRGTYYRDAAKHFNDATAGRKAKTINAYVRLILLGIKEIYPSIPEMLTKSYDSLLKLI